MEQSGSLKESRWLIFVARVLTIKWTVKIHFLGLILAVKSGCLDKSNLHVRDDHNITSSSKENRETYIIRFLHTDITYVCAIYYNLKGQHTKFA